MSDAATIAIALVGNCAANFVLLCAYSRAVMPGVTALELVSRKCCFRQIPTHVRQLSEGVDVFHEVVVRIEVGTHEQPTR